tara:strand:- start:1883 stop:3214 length:1332 start_codon:yes stop_codon:yes gene_type:complete
MNILKTLMINFLKNKDKIRITKNISGNSIRVFSLFLVQLFYLPMMFYLWGIEKTGYWLYLLAIPNLLSFWKLNFTEAAKQELIIKKNINRNEVYSISFLFCCLTILVFAIVYFTINFRFINSFEIFSNIEIYNFNWILILIFLSFSIDLFTNNFLTISQYTGKIYPSQIISSIFNILEKLIIPLIGFFTNQLFYAAICLLLLKIIQYVISKHIIKKYIINMSLNFKKFNKHIVLDIFKKSTSFFFNDLSSVINTSGFIYFIGYFFAVEVVAMIAALQTLFKFIMFWVTSIFDNVVRYEFANYYKKKKYINIVKLYKFQKKMLYFLLFTFLLVTYLLGQKFFNIWTNNSFNYDIIIIYLIALETVIFLLGYNQILLLYSLNKIKKISLYTLIINILSFAFLFSFEVMRVDLKTIYYVLLFKGSLIYFINMISNYRFQKFMLLKI